MYLAMSRWGSWSNQAPTFSLSRNDITSPLHGLVRRARLALLHGHLGVLEVDVPPRGAPLREGPDEADGDGDEAQQRDRGPEVPIEGAPGGASAAGAGVGWAGVDHIAVWGEYGHLREQAQAYKQLPREHSFD